VTNVDHEPERVASGELNARRARRTLRWIRALVMWYGAFTFAVSGMSTALGVVLLWERLTSIGLLIAGLGAYGLVCGFGLVGSWAGIRRERPQALRWLRLTLFASLPGAILCGLLGVLLMWLESGYGFLMGAWLTAVTIFNVFALVRLLWKSDFDQLLWSDVAAKVRLNFESLPDDDQTRLPARRSTAEQRSVACLTARPDPTGHIGT